TKDWSRVDFKIRVAFQSDLARVVKTLSEEASKLKKDYSDIVLEDPEMLGVDEIGESEIIVRVLIKVLPGKQWMLKREFNRRIKERFDQEGIEIPLPQRAIWSKTL